MDSYLEQHEGHQGGGLAIPAHLPHLESNRRVFPCRVFTLAAATHAYYTLCLRSEPTPFIAAALQIARLGLLGDFDLFEFEGVDTVYTKSPGTETWEPEDPAPSASYYYALILFSVVGFFFTVLLMNLFIGVLSSAYDIEEDRAAAVYTRELALTSVKFRRQLWVRALDKAFQICCKVDNEDAKQVFVLARDEPDEDAMRSMRSCVQDSQRKIVDHVTDLVNTKFDDTRKNTIDHVTDLANIKFEDSQQKTIDHVTDLVNTKFDECQQKIIEVNQKVENSTKKISQIDEKLDKILALVSAGANELDRIVE